MAQPKRSVTIVAVTPPSHHTQPQSCESWSWVEGREYHDLSGDDPNQQSDRKSPADSERLQ
jgi:hypothetical protein